MELRLLGPVVVEGSLGSVATGGPKERAVLAMLALRANEVVADGSLIDGLWGDEPPPSAARTLQAYLSRLRRTLADAGIGAERLTIESQPSGWRLVAAGDAIDVAHAERLLGQGRAARERGDHVDAALVLAEAQRCWRGRALAEFGDLLWAQIGAARLEELHLHVIEERIDAELACGRHHAVAAELEGLCMAHPLRERLWGARMLALYRAGRQADALRAYQDLRLRLADELGIDPTPALARLEQQVLAQAADLDPPAPRLRAQTAGQPDDPPPGLRLRGVEGFVGREAGLADLDERWRRTREGSLEIVLLAGEPGIGKTSLAIHHAESLATTGAWVLFGRCDEDDLVPFQPFVEAVSQHVASVPPGVLRDQLGARAVDLSTLVPELTQLLPEVAGPASASPETERYRLFEAVSTLLRAMGRTAPVLLLIDDLHWADRPTLQLLEHIVRRTGSSPLMIVGTYRDTDLVRSHPLAETLADLRRTGTVTRLALRGLAAPEVEALVAGGEDPEAADAALAAALWRETEGSPLFLRESLRHLQESGAVVREGARYVAQRHLDHLGIPEGVREAIGRRLTRLSEDANHVLRCGSVQGREVQVDVLELVTGLDRDTVIDALDEATVAGILDEVPATAGRYAFTHALVREALYDEELSLTRRVRLHQRVAEALEAIAHPKGLPLAELAHHYTQSAVAGTAEQAVDFSRRAAEHARGLLAHEDAARHLANAIEVAEDADLDALVIARLSIDRGDCLWFTRSQDQARHAYEHALRVAVDDPGVLVDAALGFAGTGHRFMWVELGDPSERSIELLRRALAVVGEGDSVPRAKLLGSLAQELYFTPGRQERERLAGECIAMARRLGDPATLGLALCAASLATMGPDTAVERAEWGAEAAAIGEAIGDAALAGHGALHRFHALSQDGDVAGARRAWAQGWSHLEPMHAPVVDTLARCWEGGTAILEGRFSDALTALEDGFKLAQEARESNAVTFYGGGIGTLLFYQGRVDHIGGVIDQGLRAFAMLDGLARALKVAVLAENDLHDEARRALRALDFEDEFTFPRNIFWTYVVHMTGVACWRLEDADHAAIVYELLLPYGDQHVGIGTIVWGPGHLALGCCAIAMGRYDTAVEHLEQARRTCDRLGWRTPGAFARVAEADARRRRGGPGDAERALELVEVALPTATTIGMERTASDADRLRCQLLGLPEPGGATPDRAGRWERTRGAVTSLSRAVVARWTSAESDEALAHRFGGATAQRVLFNGMAAGFQPHLAFGFEGDITIELTPLPSEPVSQPSVWWTIEVRGRRARIRSGSSPTAAVLIRCNIVDFVRVGAGEVDGMELMRQGRFFVRGDLVLALRLPELFGLVSPDLG